MQQYIKKLRLKPEETRKQILIWSLILCMSLVLLVWFTTIGHQTQSKKEKEIVKQEETENIKPFSMIKTSIKETYEDIYSSVGDINSQMKEEIKVEVPQKQIDLIPIEE